MVNFIALSIATLAFVSGAIAQNPTINCSPTFQGKCGGELVQSGVATQAQLRAIVSRDRPGLDLDNRQVLDAIFLCQPTQTPRWGFGNVLCRFGECRPAVDNGLPFCAGPEVPLP
ncbi:hypothetical protein B0T21DRAFT_416236 [Apiosordaria backusii]|uniref:Uncharacterized protein n=1 Tax=Apiosordaria backusii TaxID=314023 RepID=A0AA40DPV4_9PEZI|nr:hypothetical protein B0T21DRAFT_416236 [Apiosordaria backusii]